MGNSITRHGPRAEIGWLHDWGMAASAPERDYVHLLTSRLFEKEDLFVMVRQLSEWERHYMDKGVPACYEAERAFAADEIVYRLGENVQPFADAEALLAGIKSRKVGAACLDVYEEESDFFFEDFSGHILEDDTLARLISMPNVIVTSHQAFLTEEALSNIAETTVDNLVSFFENGQCPNELCYRCGAAEDCKSGKCF